MYSSTWKWLNCLVMCVLGASFARAQPLAITGVYQGKPLFIQNPMTEEAGEFCIRQVLLNNRPLDLNYKLSALEITFKDIDLYTPVSIHILHDSLCSPRILNPKAIYWHSAFHFTAISVNDEELKWATIGERENSEYAIEKLNGSDWIEVGRVPSNGRFTADEYTFGPDHTEGPNKYRVKYLTSNGNYLFSEEVEMVFYKEPITFSPHVVTNKMTLSRAADFEILNQNEEVILQGNAKEIPLRLLKPGNYFIVLDGVKEPFVKK